jgi:hypothetical protein
MTPRVYTSAFKRTGLIPFNPKIVLNTIGEYKAKQRIEEPPPNSPRSESPSALATSSITSTYKLERLAYTFDNENAQEGSRLRTVPDC